MSFENAPVSKGVASLGRAVAKLTADFLAGLMVVSGLTSFLVGLFDLKHYFHLQVSLGFYLCCDSHLCGEYLLHS